MQLSHFFRKYTGHRICIFDAIHLKKHLPYLLLFLFFSASTEKVELILTRQSGNAALYDALSSYPS